MNTIVSRDKTFIPLITVISILIPVVVAILMVIPQRDALGDLDVSSLPLFHATLNGATAFMLSIGFYFIKNKKIALHRFSMLTAFLLSSIFLVSYVIYHYTTPPTPFGGEGLIRTIYFFITYSYCACNSNSSSCSFIYLQGTIRAN